MEYRECLSERILEVKDCLYMSLLSDMYKHKNHNFKVHDFKI